MPMTLGDLTPMFAETCYELAEQWSALSRHAYRAGDESKGDRCFARALAWALAAESGELPTGWRP